MNEQWRKQLQQKLDGHRQAAPQLSWDEVERRAVIGVKPARASILGRRIIAAAASVALLAGVGVTMLLLNNGQNARQVANLERQYAPQQNGTKPAENGANVVANKHDAEQGPLDKDAAGDGNIRNGQASNARHLVAYGQGEGTDIYTPVTAPSQQTANTPQQTTETTPDIQQNTPNNTSKNSTDNAPQKGQSTRTQPKYPEDLPVGFPRSSTKTSKGGGVWMAKAYVSGGAIASNNSEVQRPALVMARTYGAPVDDDIRNSEYVQLQDASPAVETKAHHRQPLRVGAALRYALSKRWSIDAGLSYTRHRSELTRKTGGVVNETQQTLHYLGVPVNVNYRIVGNRRFNVYASAGVMGEKLLKGKRKSVAEYDGVPEEEQTENVKEKRAQLSVNAAIGAEYKLYDRLSVFAEPGVSYYFDNGSDLTSIYKDRPTNFNLNVGLRFCINK